MQSKHNYVVDIIKIFSAILVIFCHAFILSNKSIDYLGSFTNGIVHFGALAVAIFFTYSGYYVSKSLIKNGDKKYISKRLKRLLPELIIVVMLCAFIIGPIFSDLSVVDYFTNSNTYLYLLNGIMVPVHNLPGVFLNNIYASTVNGSLWTLSIEFACYVYLLILYKLGFLNDKKSGIIGYIISIVFAIFGLFCLNILNGYINVDLLKSVIRPFMIFITASFISVRYKNIDIKGFLISLLLFVIFLITRNYYLINIAFIFFLPIVIMYISTTIVLKGNDIISFIGESSYTVYLFGFVVQQCVVSIFGGKMNPYLNFGVSLLFSLLLGFILNGFMKIIRNKIKWL